MKSIILNYCSFLGTAQIRLVDLPTISSSTTFFYWMSPSSMAAQWIPEPPHCNLPHTPLFYTHHCNSDNSNSHNSCVDSSCDFFVCTSPLWAVYRSLLEARALFKIKLGSHVNPVWSGYQEMFWELNAVCMIMTTSPVMCRLIYKHFKASTMYPIHFIIWRCVLTTLLFTFIIFF